MRKLFKMLNIKVFQKKKHKINSIPLIFAPLNKKF